MTTASFGDGPRPLAVIVVIEDNIQKFYYYSKVKEFKEMILCLKAAKRKFQGYRLSRSR